MKKGDISGKGEVYNEQGLICKPSERILMKFINCLFCVANTSIDEIMEHGSEKYEKREILNRMARQSFYMHAREGDYTYPTSNRLNSSHQIYPLLVPATIYITSMRIVSIWEPSPSLTWGVTTLPLGIAIHEKKVYLYERKLHRSHGKFFVEIFWDELNNVIVSKNQITLLHTDDTRGYGISIGLRRFTQIPQMKKVLLILKEKGISYNFINQSKSWNDLFSKFKFGDADGLNKIYDKEGRFIKEKGEVIRSQKGDATPHIVLKKRHGVLFVKKYEDLKPLKGVLYETNKRIVFIREINEYDSKYTTFSIGTHVYFSFALEDSIVKHGKNTNIYKIPINNRMGVEVSIPYNGKGIK